MNKMNKRTRKRKSGFSRVGFQHSEKLCIRCDICKKFIKGGMIGMKNHEQYSRTHKERIKNFFGEDPNLKKRKKQKKKKENLFEEVNSFLIDSSTDFNFPTRKRNTKKKKPRKKSTISNPFTTLPCDFIAEEEVLEEELEKREKIEKIFSKKNTSSLWEVEKCLKNIEISLSCPISKDLFRIPRIIEIGHSFEKSLIEYWLSKHDTDPISFKQINQKTHYKNILVEELVKTWKELNIIELINNQKREVSMDINDEELKLKEEIILESIKSKISKLEDQLKCKISKKLMKFPVVLGESGYCYELENILNHMIDNDYDFLTKETLKSKKVIQNFVVKNVTSDLIKCKKEYLKIGIVF